jgi:hypothetical protein
MKDDREPCNSGRDQTHWHSSSGFARQSKELLPRNLSDRQAIARHAAPSARAPRALGKGTVRNHAKLAESGMLAARLAPAILHQWGVEIMNFRTRREPRRGARYRNAPAIGAGPPGTTSAGFA